MMVSFIDKRKGLTLCIYLLQGNEGYNYAQLSPNSERHRYTSGEPRNKISPSSDEHRTRFNSDELHRTRNNSDEQHRTRYQSDEQHRTRNNSDEQHRTRFQSDEPRRPKTSNSEDQAYRHRNSPPDSGKNLTKVLKPKTFSNIVVLNLLYQATHILYLKMVSHLEYQVHTITPIDTLKMLVCAVKI